jgi:autotransporter-associated beta strand protein
LAFYRPHLERLEDRLAPTVTLLSHFAGLNFGASGGFDPPDSNGAASWGTNNVDYVETVNQTIAIYNKTTGAQAHADNLAHFWTTVGQLGRADAGSSFSDPVITFDELSQRFLVGDQDVNFATHVSRFDIAVSIGPNPADLTGQNWHFFQITTTEAGFDADYPGNLGYNHDALVFTLNMLTGGAIDHVQINAINMNALTNGNPLVEGTNAFQVDHAGASLRPAVMHDSVAGDGMWLVQEHGNGISIDVFHMTNVLNAAPTFTVTNLPVTPYAGAVAPLQPNGTAITTNINSRIQKVAERNGTLVAAHTVSLTTIPDNEDQVQWYSINVTGATPTLNDQGDVAPGATSYDTYPAIDINTDGSIGMTFMNSGTGVGQFLSVYAVGRVTGDNPGIMEAPVLVQGGLRNYSGAGRAGDLSGISVDLDGSFWIASEFADNEQPGANWGTAIGNFKIAPSNMNYVAVNGGTAHNFRLVRNQGTGNVELYDNGILVLTQRTSDTHNINIGAQTGADSSLTIDYSGGTFTNTVTFDGGTGTGTHSLLLENGGTFTNKTFTLTSASAGTINIGTQAITFSDTGSVTDATPGSGTLSETGSGTVIVTGSGSYSQTTIGSGATLQVGSNGLGGSLGTAAITDNGSLLLDRGNTITVSSAITGSGSVTQAGAGTAILSGTNGYSGGTFVTGGVLQGSTTSLQGNINLTNNASLVFDQTTTGTYAGIISGTGSVTKQDTGAVMLNGASTYTGPTLIKAGTLQVHGTNAIPSTSDVTDNGTLDFASAALDTIGFLAGTGSVTNSTADGGALTIGATGHDATFSGVIQGKLAVTITGNVIETFLGLNVYTGVTTINAGATLRVGKTNAVSATGTVDNGTLDLNGVSDVIGYLAGSGTVTSGVTGPVTLTTVQGDGATVGGSFSGTIQDGHGIVSLTADGAVLSGTDTYTGLTTIGSLGLGLGSATALPDGPITFSDASSSLDLNGFSQQVTSVTGNGEVYTLKSNPVTFTLNNASTDIFSGNILQGSLTFVKTGSGSLTLSGPGQDDAPTTISQGTLQVNGTNVLPGVDVTDNGTLDLHGNSVSVAALRGNGIVTSTVQGAVTLTVAGGPDNPIFSGIIQNGNGPVSLTMIGSGTETLAGANTYTGGTTVSAGSLLVNGSLSTTGVVTVRSGATLGGTGSTGTVSVSASGAVFPGISAASTGILTTGNITFSSSSSYDVALNGTSDGSGYDQLNVNGSVNLGGATLTVSLGQGFTPAIGSVFTIIDNGGGGAVVGTFQGLGEGATIVLNGMTFQISYVGGSTANDVTLTRTA